MPLLSVVQPFDSSAIVTTSSTHGHHRPYGGTHSCDLDVLTASRGSPVTFELVTNGPEVRGVVESVRPACASGVIANGGSCVQLRIERHDAEWVPTGLRLLFAHLDPVLVSVGDIVTASGTPIGALGPAEAQDWSHGASCGTAHGPDDPRREEYHSSCCVHSHTHIEGFGANMVAGRSTRLAAGDVIMSFEVAGTAAPEEIEVARSATYTVVQGDTLADVANRLGVSLVALVAANADLLRPGQVLAVPGSSYEVRPRDTLGEIARRFGVTVEAIASANGIVNVNVISVGQILVIPR
jgi:LysM repeat protein